MHIKLLDSIAKEINKIAGGGRIGQDRCLAAEGPSKCNALFGLPQKVILHEKKSGDLTQEIYRDFFSKQNDFL